MDTIITPPKRVSILGCSFIIVNPDRTYYSFKQNRLTSAAGINLGAIVTKTKVLPQRIHITGTIIRSLSIGAKLSIKNEAK